jgi:hypothetical protein
MKRSACESLDEMLIDKFDRLGIKYERSTWDSAKNKEGKPEKRKVNLADVQTLKPFHWGYEFDDILIKRGGFDAIITNPPWEIFSRTQRNSLRSIRAL